jgi:hypothetical protein
MGSLEALEWETRPGDSWETSPPVEVDGEHAIVYGGPGGLASDWVRCPANMPGYEERAGEKMRIDGVRVLGQGERPCPVCGDAGAKRMLILEDGALVVLECLACRQFMWLEAGRREGGALCVPHTERIETTGGTA